ncbi:MAG TPA: hypothetical protein VFU27_14240 [Terriglobales bacterium]|nr:hypothetical protein [Terriglobales bacterium]
MSVLDIIVLALFAMLAAVGVGSHPRGNVAASDWLSRIGMAGVVLWLCWIFLRPGGESAHNVFQVFKDFFSQ